MKLVLQRSFLGDAKKLPSAVQNRLARLLELLEGNPFHPLLHTKRLHGALAGFLSFRISRDWRVIFYFENPDTICVVKVGNRKDIYQ